MRKPAIHPDDFPVEASETAVMTNKGKPLAEAESEPVERDIADRLNEAGLSRGARPLVAMTPETRGLCGSTPVSAGLPPRGS
ncbi:MULTISPECIES: hypothetical protein [Bradyrhizobium]|uniref:hypothetical protein n=1 Tax=Bradyrhizobium TaxID=374 RepID=UPI0013E8D3F7|nr:MULTISPECIES: hypothetical protein [Bradyrhizobium]